MNAYHRTLMLLLMVCGTASCSAPPSNTPTVPTIPPTALPTEASMGGPQVTPASRSRVDDLMARMTLEQKVGQVMMIGFDGTALPTDLREMIEQYFIGGVILYERNVESPRALAQLDADMQNAAQQNGQPGLFISIDQEGGIVARLKEEKGFSEFPGAMAIAATGDPGNARLMAGALAAELKALGINMDLAPDLDVNNNPANPVIGARSFGSDPARVAAFGTAFIEGLQANGIMAVGKHFPGHGDTGVDSHVALPTVPHDRARLEAVEFVPFKAAMKAGVAGIMSAHITFPAIDPTPGLAATLSPKVLTGLVRDEMRYDGLLMTDSLAMGALAQSGYPVPQAAATALKAGADVLLFNNGYELHRQAHRLIVDWVQRGVIPQARLDEAVRRVLSAKERFGLLDGVSINVEAAASQSGTEPHRALARQVSAQSITLLRDDAGLLPLKPDAKLFVVETGSFGLGKLLAATTMQTGANPKPAEISTIVERGKEGRTLIVLTSDTAKNRAQADLVNALLAAKVPVIVVAARAPYDLLWFKAAPTYLAVYNTSAPTLAALAAVLNGTAKPQGHLPVEMPGLYALGDGLTAWPH